MDTADAMEVTESIPADLPTLDVDHANDEQVEPDETTNDVAMQQLSLEPTEAPVNAPSPTYRESPSTDPGSPLAPEDSVANEEKEKEAEDNIDSSEPKATGNTVPQNVEQATLDPPLPLANAISTALTTTTTTSTTTTEGNTDKTNIDTEMEEDRPTIPEPTETPNNSTTEAPSSEPTTVNQAPSPAPTAMDEDPEDETTKPETNTNTAVTKYVPPNVVDDADSGGTSKAADVPDKGKGKSKDADALGWGPVEPENPRVGGATNTDTDLSGWGLKDIGTSAWTAGSGGGGGGGDTNTTNTSSNPWETRIDSGNGNSNSNGNVMANGDSGFGNRTGGWGDRGRDRDSYGSRDRDRDRDSFRDKDGLRRTRPASFGNGFGGGGGLGSGGGGPPFASGSNTEFLPPLGRSPVKNMNSDRHARLARSAPYPPRRETRSGDWGSAGLDYGSAGDDWIMGGGAGAGAGGGGTGGINGTVILSQKPVVLNEMDLGGLDTLSKTMNNADIKAITNSLMDHIGQIQKWRNRNIDAHNLVRQCGHDYTERKAELQACLSVESDPQKKAAIASKLEAHRLKGRAEENLLEATVLSTETSMKREVEALIHTISEAMADKIHACILDVVRAVSTSGVGVGVGCDVEKVVERCVSIATPKLVRDQLGAQEKLIRGLERRVGQLDDSLQERNKTIVDLNRRMKRLEGKVANEAEGGHDLMVTDTNSTSPGISSTTVTTDGDSDSLAIPGAHSQSSVSTNCVHQ